MKTCPCCKKEKSHRGFNRNRNRPDGVEVNCRKCVQLKKQPGLARELCDTHGCDEHRRRYHSHCDICLSDYRGICDTIGCTNPRAVDRKICCLCRKEQHKARSKLRRCATPGCNKSAQFHDKCAPCTEDQAKPELLLNSRECVRCGENKLLLDFGRWKRSDDGRAQTCRTCSAVKNAEAAEKRENGDNFGAKYHEAGYSLGFACSQMLSVPMRNEIPAEWRHLA